MPFARILPDATCDANDFGGVHETLVLVVFVAMVPVADPKVYVSVCVKDDEARSMVIVRAVPIKVEEPLMLMDDVRGIVVNASAVVDAKDMFGTMLPVCVFRTAVMSPDAMVLVPSASCSTVAVPVANVKESFLSIV